MRNKPLTAAFVNNIRKRGRYEDGHGGHGLTLDMKIARNGRMAKSWIQRVRMNDNCQLASKTIQQLVPKTVQSNLKISSAFSSCPGSP